MNRKFQISVRSNFAELWRYNIVVMCGAYSADGEQLSVTSSESTLAAVGDDVKPQSVEDASSRKVTLTTEPCDNIKAYIYLMPHKLPATREPEDAAPFGLRIKVKADDEVVYNVVHQVNQWSGATVELQLPKAE